MFHRCSPLSLKVGDVVLLGETAAIGERHWAVTHVLDGIHMNPRTQIFLAKHCMLTKLNKRHNHDRFIQYYDYNDFKFLAVKISHQ